MNRNMFSMLCILIGILLGCSTNTSDVEMDDANLKDPVEVVQLYYQYKAENDYEKAWSLFYATEQNNPDFKENFMAAKDESSLVSAAKGEELEEYKPIATQVMELNGVTVVGTMKDGQQRTFHLLKEENGNWGLLWDTERNRLEQFNQQGKHAALSSLTKEELDALIEYVNSIE